MGEDCERTALERRKPAPRTPRRARPAPVPWEARVLLDELGELCLWPHSGPVDLEGGHRPRLAAPSRVLPRQNEAAGTSCGVLEGRQGFLSWDFIGNPVFALRAAAFVYSGGATVRGSRSRGARSLLRGVLDHVSSPGPAATRRSFVSALGPL